MTQCVDCRLLWLSAIILGLVCSGTASAQNAEGYQPLNEKLPPGFNAEILARIRQYDPVYLQPVRVELPTEGTVAVYSANPAPLATLSTPAQFSVTAGHFYRLKIAEMPEFPGVEIYPSIEILDRLHPPEGTAANYPIPVVFSQSDLKEAISGRMVTRVIYLEQPQLAAIKDPLRREVPQTVDPAGNALQEADRLGRPMMIVRIGGRLPDSTNMPLSFYGSGGPFDIAQPTATQPGMVRLRKQRMEQRNDDRDALMMAKHQ
jgi:hypothetical protein